MPLSAPDARREVHDRTIDMKVYARADGLFDVEAHLIDRKPFPFWRVEREAPIPPGEPLHDLSIRVTVDDRFIVRAIEASSDATPFALCREAERTLSVLVGERIGSGWTLKVRGALRGAASCTHLMEMLITLATTALQGIHGLRKDRVAMNADAVAPKLDSCYSYSRQRAVVKTYWPEHYRAPEAGTPGTAGPEKVNILQNGSG